MVPANARIGGGRICRLVRPGGGKLRLGRAKRMETGPPRKSGTTVFDAACTGRRERGRLPQSTDSGSRADPRIVELRSRTRRARELERGTETRTGAKGNFETKSGGPGSVAPPLGHSSHPRDGQFARSLFRRFKRCAGESLRAMVEHHQTSQHRES